MLCYVNRFQALSQSRYIQEAHYRSDRARRIGRINTKCPPLRRSGSFKVINFDTNRKPVCYFLLPNNTDCVTVGLLSFN